MVARGAVEEGLMDTTVDNQVMEVIYSCRAMRRFQATEVPDSVIVALIDAAIRAPSGSNAQNWRFIVIRDPAVKQELGIEVRRGTRWKATIERIRLGAHIRAGRITREEEARGRRQLAAFEELAERYEDTPVLICVCVAPDEEVVRLGYSWASIRSALREFGLIGTLRAALVGRRHALQGMWATGYPAVQNLLLAARAKGLGAALTAPQILSPPGRIEKILQIPRGVKLCAIVPVGYPKGHFGPVRRKPVGEFIFEDRYGNRGDRLGVE
jgi:nitroreductase